jgi:hypothetical protein
MGPLFTRCYHLWQRTTRHIIMYYSGPHLHEENWCLTLAYNISCDTASGGSNMLSRAIIYVPHLDELPTHLCVGNSPYVSLTQFGECVASRIHWKGAVIIIIGLKWALQCKWAVRGVNGRCVVSKMGSVVGVWSCTCTCSTLIVKKLLLKFRKRKKKKNTPGARDTFVSRGPVIIRLAPFLCLFLSLFHCRCAILWLFIVYSSCKL